MDKRIGVIGIVIEDRNKAADTINETLSQYGDIILGRMGVPSRELDLSLMALLVEGTPDQIGAMTGKLGNLDGVSIKSGLTSKVVE